MLYNAAKLGCKMNELVTSKQKPANWAYKRKAAATQNKQRSKTLNYTQTSNKMAHTQRCRLTNQGTSMPSHFLFAAVTAEYAFLANCHPLRIYAGTGFPGQLSVLRWFCRA